MDGAIDREYVLCGWFKTETRACFVFTVQLRDRCMFCVDCATERPVHVSHGWSNRETSACFVWIVQQRDQCMFCVDCATERLVHVLCGWCN